MFDVGVLLNRLDELEAKVHHYEAKVDHCEAKLAEHEDMVSLVNQHDLKIKSHEMKINSQQEEIDQLKKKNLELEEKNNQIVQSDDDLTNRDFLPRSCFEIKATNPNAQSGVYSIDPDGQIGADQPINVYCDMTTGNIYIHLLLKNVKSCFML